MTEYEDSRRVKRSRPETMYESRFPRYAANSLTQAEFAEGRRNAVRRSAFISRSAAANARKNGDETAAELYDELADAHDDIAEAHDEIAEIERELAEHFSTGQGDA